MLNSMLFITDFCWLNKWINMTLFGSLIFSIVLISFMNKRQCFTSMLLRFKTSTIFFIKIEHVCFTDTLRGGNSCATFLAKPRVSSNMISWSIPPLRPAFQTSSSLVSQSLVVLFALFF